MSRLKLAILLLSLLFANVAEGKTVVVSSATELAKVKAYGDTEIVWRNGKYADEVVTITASGTAKKPLIIRAESDGGVRFTGKSSLRIKGSHIVVRGFVWDNPFRWSSVRPFAHRSNPKTEVAKCEVGDKSNS